MHMVFAMLILCAVTVGITVVEGELTLPSVCDDVFAGPLFLSIF
jgi:hypothetical protein